LNNQWYDTFFQGVALDMWRKVATLEMTKGEADFLVQAPQMAPGARVLDVPCGNGRHAIELASRGYNLTGVDISPGFLEEARQSPAAIDWRQSDMRDLPWESAFDAAYCWGNSFGYFPHAEVPGFCQAVGRALKPGARLVIDTGLAAESILPTLQPRRWYQLDDLYLLHETRYLVEESRVQSDYIFLRNGTVDTRTALYSVFTIAELRRVLLDHGSLVVEALYSSLDRQAFTVGSQRLLLVARKEGG